MIQRLSFSHHYLRPKVDDVEGEGENYAKYSNSKYANMQNLRPKVNDVEGEGKGGEEDEEGGGGSDQFLAHRGEHQRELPAFPHRSQSDHY